MGEGRCIRTAQGDVLQVWQGGKTAGFQIQVVRHERGGLKLTSCETRMIGQPTPTPESDPETQRPAEDTPPQTEPAPREIGGRGGLEPTRYGDWEKNGRCIDF
ncbi:DUF1674 domain-containing protein [Xanthomonas sacchari]|uniref:DUF1674 domain-containing protein n=1 Tax=Xanthomonas sacchari TaxID=56458 RepID=UPI000262B160|nr:DUF1674 domain-containing protein [Xanthomonas sacchari]